VLTGIEGIFGAEQTLAFLPLLALVGILAGLLAGLFGVGGGLVVVPCLYALLRSSGMPLEDAMAMALASSLASIVPTAWASARAHQAHSNVHWALVKRWVPGIFLGVFLGALLISHWRSRFFALYFALFLLCVAVYQWLPRPDQPARAPSLQVLPNLLAGFFQGFMSVLAGVGGGTIGVPLLLAMGLGIHQAIGTSAALGFFVALPAAAILALAADTPGGAPAGSFGLVYWPALVVITPCTLLSAPWGARLAARCSPAVLKRSFSLLLLLIAIKMLISAWPV
jgi:uncharacterized protein